MVDDLMPEEGYLPDDGFIAAFWNDVEILTAADPQGMLYLRGCQ